MRSKLPVVTASLLLPPEVTAERFSGEHAFVIESSLERAASISFVVGSVLERGCEHVGEIAGAA